MHTDRPHLSTERLILRMPGQSDVPGLIRYFDENAEHLRPWEPVRHPDFLTPEFWETQIEKYEEEFRADRALRLFMFDKSNAERVIGVASFSNYVRRSAQYCNLGYSVSLKEQGKGHMQEGLRAAIDYVYKELNMHRVMANYMPRNERSGRLLRRLGFVVEGYARDYLLINGRWEDHILTSLVNPDWQPGQARKR